MKAIRTQSGNHADPHFEEFVDDADEEQRICLCLCGLCFDPRQLQFGCICPDCTHGTRFEPAAGV